MAIVILYTELKKNDSVGLNKRLESIGESNKGKEVIVLLVSKGVVHT